MKDKVAKMLGKQKWEPIDVVKEDAADFHVISENSKQFKSKLSNEKKRLKDKLPKPTKLSKMDLGNKYR